MKISQLQETLKTMDVVPFVLPNGTFVPAHCHLTEIGLATKTFIDCGAKKHQDKKVLLQLWTSVDTHHRLKADKFLNIIHSSLSLFEGEDLDVEVEYQVADTVGRFSLDFDGTKFTLQGTKTDCLATDLCGIDAIKNKTRKSLSALGDNTVACTPGGGCC